MNDYKFNTRRWIQVAIINFCIVALAGIILRYKINFPLPFIDQKYLLHAHSHFAFTGWVTLVLMALMVNYLQQQNIITSYKKYYWTLLVNCISAFGMLFSFVAQGYAFYSIAFSTLSIFVSYVFIFYYWRDLNKTKGESYTHIWFKTALTIWAVSSLGAFALAFLMANHIMMQDYYFAAVYFFLHFQYNGWFLFVCFGLLFSHLYAKGFLSSATISKNLFFIMAITVGPTYFLSILWLKLPRGLHLIGEISGILQLAVLFYFIKLLVILKKSKSARFTFVTKCLWVMTSIAFIIKIILQMLSIIPLLSSYAFGFRPIVIGYLHLSFLGIISFFILGYINQALSETYKQISKAGVIFFVTGVLVQEIALMGQGLEAIGSTSLPFANIILFYVAILIGVGLIWIAWGLSRKPENSSPF